MCIICNEIENENISLYDASLWTIELMPIIGQAHAEIILRTLKKLEQKAEESEIRYDPFYDMD